MKTPRTDANESLTCKEGDPCIAPGFARQLETELAAMTDLADRLAEALKNVLGNSWDGPLPDYARHKASAVRIAYENHKTKTP